MKVCVCLHPSNEHKWADGYCMCRHIYRSPGMPPRLCACMDFVEDDFDARLEEAQERHMEVSE